MPFVIKPGRYVGNEFNVIRKEHSGRTRVALGFPDLYEIGMSYLGLSILYHIISSRDDCVAERFFAVDVDAERILRNLEIPMFSLESWTPLKEFDIVGFSLTHELNYTNMLNILNLSEIPLLSRERDQSYPLIIAGGPSFSNPEPMAQFIDAFAIGDGEEVIHEILDIYGKLKSRKSKKEEILRELSKLPGVYVPSLYEAEYDRNGNFKSLLPRFGDIPRLIQRRAVQNLKMEFYTQTPLVPLIEITHDRLDLEIMRGCAWRCNFCHARQLYAPLRKREIDDLLLQAKSGISNSGWDEISLLSLSAADYPQLSKLIGRLNELFYQKRISVALPSMRPDSFTKDLARQILRTKKTGLTFAPETGTARLRKLIGKDVEEERLLSTVDLAYSSGWNLVKLYFMIGLPTETEEDLMGIVNIIHKVLQVGRRTGPNKNLNVTISPFVPKPHTPFQREKQTSIEQTKSKTDLLKSFLKDRHLSLKIRNPEVSYLEGVLARGDRRISTAILSAWQEGARFDAWTEHFNSEIWKKSFDKNNINPDSYLEAKEQERPLPWDHISFSKSKNLFEEQEKYLPDLLERKPGQERETLSNWDGQEDAYGRGKKRKAVSAQLKVARSRVRLRWAKDEKVRFASHLDTIRMFERAVRRSEIPIAYSEGFHPHPKMAFGPPLPLGFISNAEYLDLQLSEPYCSSYFSDLDRSLHPGFSLLEAKVIFSRSVSLSSSINLAIYEVTLELPIDAIEWKLRALLSKDTLPIVRKTKDGERQMEARSSIKHLECQNLDGKTSLELALVLDPKGHVRPEEILGFGLGLDEKEIAESSIKRVALLVQKEDKALTPMEMV